MATPIAEPRISTLRLSDGAEAVLQEIMQLTGKAPGAIVAEGLALAKFYEENRSRGGRLMRDYDGKLEEVIVP